MNTQEQHPFAPARPGGFICLAVNGTRTCGRPVIHPVHGTPMDDLAALREQIVSRVAAEDARPMLAILDRVTASLRGRE